MQELKQIETEADLEAAIAAEEAEATPTEISVEQLPIHVLREKLDEKGIVYKGSDKKKDLVKALLSGETTVKVVEKKKAPTMESTITPKALPVLSKTLKEELDKLAAQGLVYTIDEEFGCINFEGKIPTSANIDQPVNNILSAARDSIRIGGRPPETNSTKPMFG